MSSLRGRLSFFPSCLCLTFGKKKLSVRAPFIVFYGFLGFNPIHLVVRQSDVVDAESTGELSDTKSPLENEIEKTPIPNALNDSMNSLEDGMSNLHDEGTLDVSDRGSWKEGEDAILSKDVSIQCELIDVVAMLAEYKENEKQGK